MSLVWNIQACRRQRNFPIIVKAARSTDKKCPQYSCLQNLLIHATGCHGDIDCVLLWILSTNINNQLGHYHPLPLNQSFFPLLRARSKYSIRKKYANFSSLFCVYPHGLPTSILALTEIDHRLYCGSVVFLLILWPPD